MGTCLSLDVKIEEESFPLTQLPEDIIIVIFLKLPVKSLMQLMCVCKSWKILISNPKFAKNHLRNSTIIHQHQRLFSSFPISYSQPLVNITSFPINPLFEKPSNPIKVHSFTKTPHYNIIGSCDGLLCLFNHRRKYVKLWNPCTRLESKTSPMIFSLDHFNLGCCGFGQDQVHDNYKALLVAINYGARFPEPVTKVYNFGTNSLKTIRNFPLNCLRSLLISIGSHVRSTLNWVTKLDKDRKWVILSFDLEKETYGEVLLPKHEISQYAPVLGVLRNCLCVCFYSGDVWLMKEYEVVDSWTKLMVMIPGYECWSRSMSWMPPIRPLCISENGVVLFHRFINNTVDFVLYDPNNGNVTYPKILSTLRSYHQFILHESLVSPLM